MPRLRRAGNHLLHWLMEALVLGLAALALLVCGFAWRLGQGPIDITAFVQRQQARLAPPGGQLSVGHASLAWEGFHATGSPVDLRAEDVHLDLPKQGLQAQIGAARATLSFPQLFAGRLAPRTLSADQVRLTLTRPAPPRENPGGAPPVLQVLFSAGALGSPALPPWFAGLRAVSLGSLDATVADPALGFTWQLHGASVDLQRSDSGVLSGHAHAGIEAGDARASVDLTATPLQDGTSVLLALSPLSPVILASLAPPLAGLAAFDLPVTLHARAQLGPTLALRQARIDADAGAGKIIRNGAVVGIASAALRLAVTAQALRLETFRLAFAAPPGKKSPPIVTVSAGSTRAAGRIRTNFIIDIPSMQLGDLGDYLPPHAGGDARTWLAENMTGGTARNAHVEGTIEAAEDFSNLALTALSGGLTADDLTLYWLKPVPPLTHGRARLVIESPDALRVTMDSAEQAGVKLLPGSNIDITKLEEKHQFGDVTAHLAGPLDATLGILNHPRLKLLSRGGFDFTGASGAVDARLTVHIPLEARVTMDDIRIASEATLTDVHLGHVAANRDLDNATLALKVNNDSLRITGGGDFAGLPTSLVLGMDFTAGGPDAEVQHITAHGTASAAQAKTAGLPDFATAMFGAGTVSLGVDYAARRDHSSTLLLDADLSDAALKTPLGWVKAQGASADAGARLSFSAGTLTGIDHVHANGPGLALASHAVLRGARTHTLVLDRVEIGQTRAHGAIGLALQKGDPLTVSLTGPSLDLSGYLQQPNDTLAKAVPSRGEKPAQPLGVPWSADLRFGSIMLAKGHALSPFSLQAASNGAHIQKADIEAGQPGPSQGQVSIRIAPQGNGRTLDVVSEDAGTFLRGMGVADNLGGGHLKLTGRFDDTEAGDPLTGTATLSQFSMRQAPAIGRLLQAMTLYGLTDVLRGPGLNFSEAVVPFTWQDRVLTLQSARAFSPSLGFTAQGDIDLRQHRADVKGTVVPAYFFNQLLGDLPVLGRLFSPEKGGGVFAARYSVTGPLDNPHVGVNPLSALTPGFLREGFGLLPHPQAAQ